MDLSIIIPSFNTKDLLGRCLDSVQANFEKSSITYEIIVVDNASTDGSTKLLKTKYPRVIKIFNTINVGYGKANNQGIQKANGRFILLLNSDIEVLDGAIEKLYQFSNDHPDVFVGGKLMNTDTSPQASCGPMYTLPVVFLMLFAKGDTLGITRSSPKEIRKTGWVSGACLMGTKKMFMDVGLFDEGIFMYMDEIEFLYRAKQKGYTTFFYPDARFIHAGAASSGDRKQPVVNIYRGLLYFYHKHRSIMEERVLRVMLFMKAYAALFVGRLTGKKQLVTIYEQALQLV